MWTRMVFLCILLSGTSVMGAQQKADSAAVAAEARERTEQLQKRLKLTPAQTERLKPIMLKETEELRGVRNKYGAQTSQRDHNSMMGEMHGVMTKHEEEINAILTSEQKAEWKRAKEERKQEKKEIKEKKEQKEKDPHGKGQGSKPPKPSSR